MNQFYSVIRCVLFVYSLVPQLTSIPRQNDNNTAVITQSTERPRCPGITPDNEVILTQQYNYNGRSTYTLHVVLESDPAALQALNFFEIRITGHFKFIQPADKFVSIKYIASAWIVFHILCLRGL